MAKFTKKDKDSTRKDSGKRNVRSFDKKKPTERRSSSGSTKPAGAGKAPSRDWDKSYKKKPSVIKYGNKSSDTSSARSFDKKEDRGKSGFREKKETTWPFKTGRPAKDSQAPKFEKKSGYARKKEDGRVDAKPEFRTRKEASEPAADRSKASFKEYRSRGDKDKKTSDPSGRKRTFKPDDRPFKPRGDSAKSATASSFKKVKEELKPEKESPRKSFEGEEEFERVVKRPRKTSDSDADKKKTFKTKTSTFKKPSAQSISRPDDGDADGKIRLNRYISNAGVCSRRDADKMIEDGMIKVNGQVVSELGYKVNPGDVVKYGNRVLNREKAVYILLNKPKDFITTMDDPEERKTVMQLVKNACKERVYPVGRLDRNTTGLLLLTNDGELAATLTHPSHEVKKIYQVDLNKPLEDADLEKIVTGNIELEDGPVQVDDIEIVSPDKQSVGLEIHEGRNRIVRRIFEHLGYEVVHLDRVMYAGLTKKDLPRGNWRFLTEKELIRLKHFL